MSDYQIIQAGRHRATCFGYELSYSSVKGTPQIALGFRMSPGDADERRVITHFRFFTDAALEYAVKDLRTLGWKGDDLGSIDEAELANEVELVVEHEVGQDGKTRAKVVFVNAIGGGMLRSETPMDEKQRKDFGREMAAKVRALGGGRKPGGTTKHRETDTRHPNAPGSDGWSPPRSDDEWG